MRTIVGSLGVVLLLQNSGYLQAASQTAHVHGEANLEVSIEGNRVLVSLHGPADGFFGFEYEPRTDEEKAVVEKAMRVLRNPRQIFVTPGAQCSVDTVEVESPFSGSADDDHHHGEDDEHSADSDHHDDDHEHEHEHADESDRHDDDHEHEHAEKSDHHEDEHEHDADHAYAHAHDHDDEHDVHSEISAEYTLVCCGQVPTTLTLSAFDEFPRLERVEAAWVNETGGGGANLTPQSPVLMLKN